MRTVGEVSLAAFKSWRSNARARPREPQKCIVVHRSQGDGYAVADHRRAAQGAGILVRFHILHATLSDGRKNAHRHTRRTTKSKTGAVTGADDSGASRALPSVSLLVDGKTNRSDDILRPKPSKFCMVALPKSGRQVPIGGSGSATWTL